MAARKRRKKRRKPNIALQILLCALAAGALLAGAIFLAHKIVKKKQPPSLAESASELASDTVSLSYSADAAPEDGSENEESASSVRKWAYPMERYFYDKDFWLGCPERDVQLLTPNPYSRPGDPLEEIHDVVIHYVDQPGSTAQQNRDYFESLKDGSRSASSHFIINTDGTIIQCIPLGEISYASNNRNFDTISIENCHPDDSGKFTDETYLSCVSLTAWLLHAFGLGPEHMIRHYDVTGKDCPIYYVKNPDAWERMKEDVAEKYAEYERLYPTGL